MRTRNYVNTYIGVSQEVAVKLPVILSGSHLKAHLQMKDQLLSSFIQVWAGLVFNGLLDWVSVSFSLLAIDLPQFLGNGPLHRIAHNVESSFPQSKWYKKEKKRARERMSKIETEVFHNLNFEVTYHHFPCHLLITRPTLVQCEMVLHKVWIPEGRLIGEYLGGWVFFGASLKNVENAWVEKFTFLLGTQHVCWNNILKCFSQYLSCIDTQ